MDQNLTELAKQIRSDIADEIFAAKSGHPGGSFSCVEILMALYFCGVANVDPHNPQWPERDRIVLSKGHAAPALYAVLANKGYFPRKDLTTLRKFGSYLQGHPDMKKIPGVDASTGSLGQGMSFSVGYALAGKRPGHHFNVYTITGDGESQEGIIWEAAMAAAHYHLDNLTVFLDHNRLQIDGPNEKVMNIEDIVAKYAAFNWETFVVDGHDLDAIVSACKAPRCGKPRFICCNTIKGKGVSFMENQAAWHGKAFNEEEYKIVKADLGV
ncbi:MAG: transketolase [Clostridia bacterium]|nr:transketolase [Clostridia bacterium]